MHPMYPGPALRPLSIAVQRLIEALEYVHAELSMPQPTAHGAELTQLASQLQDQICTLVKLLAPVPPPPGGLGAMLLPVPGGRGQPQ